MAAATNTNASSTEAGPIAGAPVVPTGPKQDSDSTTETSGAAGIDVWTIFWLAFALAVFVWMWRSGKLAAIRKFIGETREQLAKCTWPTMGELKQHIVVVMISSILLGIFTVISDNIVRFIVWDLLMGGGAQS